MTRSKYGKLNYLMAKMPTGVILTAQWLKEHGISPKLAWWYVHSNWLEHIDEGIYKKVDDNITWIGAVAAAQSQLHLPLHVGGKSALELLGYAHFIPMNGKEPIKLFALPNTRIPKWLSNQSGWEGELSVVRAKLFAPSPLIAPVKRAINGIEIAVSGPERALMEAIYGVPHDLPYGEAYLLAEVAGQMRPRIIQALLEACHSIKVKRLLLHFARLFQHAWLPEVSLEKVYLGQGKRVIGQGGTYDAEFQLSVPRVRGE